MLTKEAKEVFDFIVLKDQTLYETYLSEDEYLSSVDSQEVLIFGQLINLSEGA